MSNPVAGRSRSNTTTTPYTGIGSVTPSGSASGSNLLSNSRGLSTPKQQSQPHKSLLSIFCSQSYDQLLDYTRSVLKASASSARSGVANFSSDSEDPLPSALGSPPPSPASTATKPISVLLFLLDSLAILREYPEEGNEEEGERRTQIEIMTTGRFDSEGGSGRREEEGDWWTVWREFVEEMVSFLSFLSTLLMVDPRAGCCWVFDVGG